MASISPTEASEVVSRGWLASTISTTFVQWLELPGVRDRVLEATKRWAAAEYAKAKEYSIKSDERAGKTLKAILTGIECPELSPSDLCDNEDPTDVSWPAVEFGRRLSIDAHFTHLVVIHDSLVSDLIERSSRVNEEIIPKEVPPGWETGPYFALLEAARRFTEGVLASKAFVARKGPILESLEAVRADLVGNGHILAPALVVQSGDALPAGGADGDAVKESSAADQTQVRARAVDGDKHRLTQEQTNEEAERLARNDPSFKRLSVHVMAGRIGCSPTTLRRTPFWASLVVEQPQRKRSKGPTPKAVTLTAAVAAVTPQTTEPDDMLSGMIAEDRVAEQRAIDAVSASGLDDAGKAALVKAIQEGETPPQKAIAIVAEYPQARAVRPHKQV